MPCSRVRVFLAVTVAAFALITSGCGRTSMFGTGGPDGGAHDGPPGDGLPHDGPPSDRPHDGACAPACADLCAELATCGYTYPGGEAVCRNDCQVGRWSADTIGCLVAGYCAPTISCSSYSQCIQHPNVSCSDVCNFAQLCQIMSTSECLPRCEAATIEERSCYSRAVADESCDELDACFRQPGTPCERICDFAIDSCGANIPRDQCLAYCEEQPQSAITCELQALGNGDCAALATCFQNPPDQADLLVSDFYAFVQGSSVYYTATVCNVGGVAAGPFDIELYYQRGTAPSTHVTGDDARSLAGLQAGACQAIQLVRPGTPTGAYSSWIQVDAFDQVAESDEWNNVEGPYQVVVGGTDQCTDVCQLAAFCGLLEQAACLQQCPLWPPDEIACAAKATLNGDCAALRECVTGPQYLPDLVVSSFTAQVAGSTVTYRVSVCNQGTVAAQGFYVDLYYDEIQAPPPWQFGDDYQPVAGLQPLGCQDLTFTRTGTPSGTYASWVQADADNYVTESNESNNVSGPLEIQVVPTPQPDLMISSFSANVAGSTVTYQVTVCNQGSAAAPATIVDVYYDRSGAPGLYQYGDQFVNVLALSAGSCATLTLSRPSTPAGTYRSWAQVDANGAIAESNEGNDVAGPIQVTVTGPPAQADLVVQSLNVTVFEQTVTYTAVVCNVGGLAAGSFAVDFYHNFPTPPVVGQVGDDRRTLNGLGAGQCATRSVTQTNTTPGTYTAWVLADSVNAVAEVNESNNTGGPKGYTVVDAPPPPQGIDLQVASFNATTYLGTVTYEVVVCNAGNQAAGHFVIDVYYDQGWPPNEGDPGQQEREVASLAAGACVNRTFVRTGTPDGTYVSWCQVDAMGEVNETNEGNNVGGPTTVTVSGGAGQRADLVVQSFLSSVSGDEVTYTATACNVGTVAAGAFYVDLYYNQPNAPGTGQFGNQSQGIAQLAAGACRTLTFVRTSTPTGTYTSWCQVDSAQNVLESNESNNVAGPAVITVSAPLDCDAVCTWLTGDCGLPGFLYSVCITLCGGVDPTRQACVQAAMAAGDCNGTWACLQ
jgi:subtilase family serine protease